VTACISYRDRRFGGTWPPSSGYKNKRSLLKAGFFLGVFFNPGGKNSMFLRNVGRLSMDYEASQLRIRNSS
jgi:hypothetical protein